MIINITINRGIFSTSINNFIWGIIHDRRQKRTNKNKHDNEYSLGGLI
jgi:hypothetical protein